MIISNKFLIVQRCTLTWDLLSQCSSQVTHSTEIGWRLARYPLAMPGYSSPRWNRQFVRRFISIGHLVSTWQKLRICSFQVESPWRELKLVPGKWVTCVPGLASGPSRASSGPGVFYRTGPHELGRSRKKSSMIKLFTIEGNKGNAFRKIISKTMFFIEKI